jgi:hypothetical protein
VQYFLCHIFQGMPYGYYKTANFIPISILPPNVFYVLPGEPSPGAVQCTAHLPLMAMKTARTAHIARHFAKTSSTCAIKLHITDKVHSSQLERGQEFCLFFQKNCISAKKIARIAIASE